MPVFYECQRCTACCRWPGQVKVSEEEVLALATFLRITEDAFIQEHTRLNSDRSGLALKERPNGECVFLQDGNCAVQPVKPQQCRDFPNLWSFPGFQKSCASVPRTVSDARYRRLVAEATGRDETEIRIPATSDPL